MQRCAPSETFGIDPSEAQLAFARARPATQSGTFRQGDAMELPFTNGRFDVATMALVIFFVPEPPRGVAEMVRVVRPGGTVAAYAWDMLGGGFPFEPIHAELRAEGVTTPQPPSPDASRIDTLRELWTNAGLENIETREIVVQRTFSNFEDFWTKTTRFGSMQAAVTALAPSVAEPFKDRVRARLPSGPSGQITYSARANAVKGLVPR
jgi:SAM-dependent methyltransferase